MKQKTFVRCMVLLITFAFLFSLMGCAQAGTSGTKETTSKTAQTQTTQTTQNTTEADGPLTAYDPAITVSVVRGIDDSMQQMMGVKEDVLTQNNWFKGYKEELGIEIDYKWTVPSSQYEQKLNAQIAANDLPDLFEVNANQLKLLVDSGMVKDMTEIFESYMSDFTRQMMEDDNYVAVSQATFNEKLMALPAVAGNRDGASMLWIRQDWLDNLGLEAPGTMDELISLAKAFTENDPNKNGTKDTYGLAVNKDLIGGGLNDLTGFFEGYGAYVNGWIMDESDKAVFGRVQPEVKQGLSALASMYANGYLDQEFAAKDNAKASEDLVGGRAGMMFGQHWNPFWPLQDSVNADADADWKAYPVPSVDGAPAKVMVHGSAGGFIAVNVDAENPEAAVKLYNYYYLKDCALSTGYDPTFHVPGTLQLERPHEAYQWAVVKSWYPMQNLFIHRGVRQYFNGDETVLENNWIKDNALQNKDYLADPVGNRNLWATYRWSGQESAFTIIDYYDTKGLMLQNAYIYGNTEGMTQYNTTLNQMALETFTKIIMGSETADAFDQFVSQWYALGGETITQEVNDLLKG